MCSKKVDVEKNMVFGSFTKFLTFKRKQFILSTNKIEPYIYYLIEGAVVILIENKGEEVCNSIFTEHQFFSSYASFLRQKPSSSYIMAIEDCKLAAISYNDLQKAYKLSSDHERNGRIISEELFLSSQERTHDLLTLSAEERYLKFLQNNPEGIKRIPLKYIASFLGMTPVSLSRVRKNILS